MYIEIYRLIKHHNFVLKECFYFFLEKRLRDIWILHDVHHITTLLHPSFKSFDISPDLLEKAVDLVKNELLKQQSSTSYVTSTANVHSPAEAAKPDHSSIATKSLLSKCFDSPKTNSQSPLSPFDELTEYMALDFQFKEDDDILLFWLKYKMKFLKLFSIAQHYNAIPASNTIVEKLFSSAKGAISDRRTSLGTEKINRNFFLKKNLKFLKEIDEQSMNEPGVTQIKRQTTEKSSHTNSNADGQQLSATATTKKFKVVEEDSDFFCNDDNDKENDETDLF